MLSAPTRPCAPASDPLLLSLPELLDLARSSDLRMPESSRTLHLPVLSDLGRAMGQYWFVALISRPQPDGPLQLHGYLQLWRPYDGDWLRWDCIHVDTSYRRQQLAKKLVNKMTQELTSHPLLRGRTLRLGWVRATSTKGWDQWLYRYLANQRVSWQQA